MIFRSGVRNRVAGALAFEPAGVLTWPTMVFVATSLGGVYMTTTFTGRDDPTQPIWQTINAGLPTDGDGYIKPAYFHADITNPGERQFVHIRQGVRTGGYLAVDTLYRRDGDGAWAAILTAPQAIALAGLSENAYDKNIYCGVNQTVADEIVVIVHQAFNKNRCLKSTNGGTTWSLASVVDSFGATNYGFSYTPVFIGQRYYIRNAGGAGLANVNYSVDGGATWGTATERAGALIAGDATGRLYARNSDLDYDLCLVGFGGTPKSIIQNDLNLYGGVYNFGGLWISALDPQRQRVLRRIFETGVVDLYETQNAWATATKIDSYVNLVEFDTYRPLIVLNDGKQDHTDWMILGYRTPDEGKPYSIFVVDRLNYPGEPLDKAGAQPGSAPFTQSIPYSAGGPIDRYGIQYA